MTLRPPVTYVGAGIPPEKTWAVDRNGASAQWHIATETPVAFVYNGRNYAVMLATPHDLEDFAVGFSMSERVINSLSQIDDLTIHQSQRGVELRFRIAQECVERLDVRQTRRNLVGQAGCGICGLDNADVLFEVLPKVRAEPVSISNAVLGRAVSALRQHQPFNQSTHSVHGAAWANSDGDIVMAREDVGRHNALDKLVGAMASASMAATSGFVVMSSRCSYEIVEKAARLGTPAVVTLSAPTSFAISKARECNLSLYCRDGDDFVRVT